MVIQINVCVPLLSWKQTSVFSQIQTALFTDLTAKDNQILVLYCKTWFVNIKSVPTKNHWSTAQNETGTAVIPLTTKRAEV